MKMRIFLLSTLFLFSLSAIKAQNWAQLTPPYNYIITSCWFDESSPNNGWFSGWRLAGADPVSYGYKTTDGGGSFSYLTFSYYFWLAQDVYFTNSINGIMVGGGIIQTVNGGDTWNLVVDNISMMGWMYDVMFADANNGYAVGQTYDNSYTSYWGVIYKTTNGGGSWTNSTITYETQNQNTDFRAVYSTGSGIIYAGGLNTLGSSSLFKSTDDGATWSALNFFNDVNSLFFTSVDTGYAATNVGIFKTTDVGSTWNNILSTTQALNSIYIKNEFGLAVGTTGQIYNTTDRGLNWTLMTSPITNQDLLRVFVVSNSLAYVVGTSGTIIKYEVPTGGIVKESDSPNEFILLQNYPNPFNPTTRIKFSLPQVSNVELKVFNILGNEVTTLINEEKPAGSYEVEFDASLLPSGVYFYQLKAENYITTKKMILMK